MYCNIPMEKIGISKLMKSVLKNIKNSGIISIVVRITLRSVVTVSLLIVKFLNGKKKNLGNKRKFKNQNEILLTGTFYSENWILNHLRPLAASTICQKIVLVTTFPLPEVDKVEYISPSGWLIKSTGKVPARLLTFILIAFKRKSAFIGGFHLLLNGMLAAVLARIVGSKSIYFCGGGPREVLDGGIHGSNLFGLMKKPDRYIEKKLVEFTRYFDLIVGMGNRTIEFFRNNGVMANCCVIPGGILQQTSVSHVNEKSSDIIFVGRLESVKRVDILLSAVKIITESLPSIQLSIVGTGSLESDLIKQVEKLEIQNNVKFTGYQRDVFSWLRKSKIFVITSDSEGLPLALMEAMTAGLPCVVSDVGELGEIVDNGINGYLVNSRSPEMFAEPLLSILNDNNLYKMLAEGALQTALKFAIGRASAEWDRILPKL